jgi:hypothetical protein
MATPPSLTRQDLVDKLAAVSHKTWIRQIAIDQQKYRSTFSVQVTDYDRERAEDAVKRLEDLGIGPRTGNRPSITRCELIDELAAVSHKTWIRQKVRDEKKYTAAYPTQVAPHDLERAEDIVECLEELGIVSWDGPR